MTTADNRMEVIAGAAERINAMGSGGIWLDLARCARLVAALQDEAACVEAMARGQYESDTGCNWHSTELSSAYRSPYYTGATDAYRALLAHLTRGKENVK